MEEFLLEMEQELSRFQGYEGWVIGKCTFQMEKTYIEHIEEARRYRKILRENSRIAVMEVGANCFGYKGSMKIRLMKPTAELHKSQEENDFSDCKEAIETEGNTLRFAQSQVDEYLEKTGDTNPIHKGANSIVPGFLIINNITEAYIPEEWKNKRIELEVRFLYPTQTGMEIFLDKIIEEQSISVCGKQQNRTCFLIHIQRK